MNQRYSLCIVLVLVTLAVGALRTYADPGACPSDSKLLNGGPTAVYGEGDVRGGLW